MNPQRLLLAATTAALIALTTIPAEARGHRHHGSHHRHIDHANRPPLASSAGSPCVSDNNGRQVCGGVSEGYQVARAASFGRAKHSTEGGVVGRRRAGFPYAFCGAEASYYVFGVTKRDLWLAANWIRKFPHTAPAPGMAAARSGHVMILMSHVSGSDWLVHDGNGGRHLTWEHVRSISGYTIVDPHSQRYAWK
jgi:hypothetical protein